MKISFDLNGSTFLDNDTFLISCNWEKNYNEYNEPIYCEIEAELHIKNRDEFIAINIFDYNGEFIDSYDARNELTEEECQNILKILYNEYNKYN